MYVLLSAAFVLLNYNAQSSKYSLKV